MLGSVEWGPFYISAESGAASSARNKNNYNKISALIWSKSERAALDGVEVEGSVAHRKAASQ